MKMLRNLRLPAVAVAATGVFFTMNLRPAGAENPPANVAVAPAAEAINALGLDLQRQLTAADPHANLCLAPFSLQSALAMTFAGADGATRAEMARVLHFPAEGDATPLHASFQALGKTLDELAARSGERAKKAKELGGPTEPITVTVANRLFVKTGFALKPMFLALVGKFYDAQPASLDFGANPAGAAREINGWVASRTRDRIRDLVPADALKADTRLVLVNALYLKAPWATEFSAAATKPEPFQVHGGAPVPVPTMQAQRHGFGYAKKEGFTAVSLPYSDYDLQFLVLLPDAPDGLAALEKKLTPAVLAECAALPAEREVRLFLPKFKQEPPTVDVGTALQALGMRQAFDQPQGSADFSGMAPRLPNAYLAISQVLHKTFLSIDEKGTEAAAATAVIMMRAGSAMRPPPEEPVEVRVDRPFFYAIQHRPSRACLFVGRVTDPR